MIVLQGWILLFPTLKKIMYFSLLILILATLDNGELNIH